MSGSCKKEKKALEYTVELCHTTIIMRHSIESGGDTVLLEPPQQEAAKKFPREKTVQPSPPPNEFDYLTQATKDDHAQSLRAVEFHDIAKAVATPKEFGKRIDAQDAKGEEPKTVIREEVSIIEELSPPPGYEEFRFYIARRTKIDEAFTPETVLLAQHRERARAYLAPYLGSSAEPFNALKEERFLSPEDRFLFENPKKEQGEGRKGEGIIVSRSVAGRGGEGIVRAALRKMKGKFFPERGVVKQPTSEAFSALTPEADLVVPLQKFLVMEEPGAEYIAKPLTTIGGEKSVFWEFVTVQENKRNRVVALNLHETIDRNLLTDQQKMTVLLHLFRGLDFLAKHGITHGDIKPQNLFLTNEQLKIGDFGLMLFNEDFMDPTYRDRWKKLWKELRSMYAYTYKNVVVGTPQYIHPRRSLGLFPEEIHPKHDVFSASMMAVALLTGYTPPEKFQKNFAYDYQGYQELKKEIDGVLNTYADHHPEAQPFATLLKQGLTEATSMINPPKVEDLLPAAEEFVRALEAMNTKESLNLQLPEDDTFLLARALRRSAADSQDETVKM